MLSALTSGAVIPAFLVVITFRSMTCYVWSGVGNLVYGGNTYLGVGDLGKIGAISEGGDAISADGTTITLSGIDATLLSETMTDVQIGAPAVISLALFDANRNILGTPYPLYVGQVDQPTVEPGLEEFSITVKLENKLINLQRAGSRRYTAADQNLYYPDDCAFNWVEQLNDQALRWGG
jgi:hypothetical protein